MILAGFVGPSCGHVGDIFGKTGGTLWYPEGFDVFLFFFLLNFGASGADFGPNLVRPEPILDRFLIDFGVDFGPMMPSIWVMRPRCCHLRADGDARSVRNCNAKIIAMQNYNAMQK